MDTSTVSLGSPTRKSDYDRLLDDIIYLASGTATFNEEKTFKDDCHFSGSIDIAGTITGEIQNYDTGWVSNSDWTNAEFSVSHNLNATLDELIVKLLVSTDGTDANAFEPAQGLYNYAAGASTGKGFTTYYVNANTIKIQTGQEGIFYINDSGVFVVIDTESWYYRAKVWKLG